LRQAREQRGLSVQDVAQKTRISVRWVQALEDARLDGLPAEVFVAGYLRSYARAVGLPGQDLMERYHALQRQREEEASLSERGGRGHLKGTALGVRQVQRPWLWLGLFLLLTAALLLVAWHRGALHI
jgi:cytoskeleton protein RodZ